MFNDKILDKFKKNKTPFYFYDLDLLSETVADAKRNADKYGYFVHYAMKANSNPTIVSKIAEYGIGADCVSGNEILRAIDCGIPSQKIVFAGVGKSDDEIKIGLENNIFCFNCESLPEIEVIDSLAKELNKTASIAVRINPNVAAHTHSFITTGLDENKFGITVSDLDKVLEKILTLKNVELIGIHFHIGSQITNMNAFKGLCLRVNEILPIFELSNIKLKHINVGGGLGIDYDNPDYLSIPDFRAYFKVFNDFLELPQDTELHFELGRSIVAQCGSLISSVLYIKEKKKKKFLILDAGMTELLRPALYQAHHKIENISSQEDLIEYDIVGPICESTDTFGKNIQLPFSKRGDLIAIRSTGAYGESMCLHYNLRDKVKSYFSNI